MSKKEKMFDSLIKDIEYNLKRIRELEAKLEVKTRVDYGEEHISMFGSTRFDFPVVDVVNSILKHLGLEISHKSYPVTTEAMVIFKSTKKKSTARTKKVCTN